MVKFVAKRILYIVVVLLMVSFILFMLFRTMPGDPVDLFLPPELASGMDPAVVAVIRAEIRETMALDRHHVVQYFYWLGAMFQGNFGMSMESRMDVVDHVRSPMANTLVINIINMVIVFCVTIPVGIYSAIKRGKTFDNVALVGTMVGISIPGFLFGLILIIIFAIFLGWLPMFGMASVFAPESGTAAWYLDRLQHMILPLAAIFLTSIAGMTRITRSAMIDALNMDYVRTARAKGLSEKTVIYIHAFRNAFIPIITFFGGFFIGVFGGSMVIEVTFAWQGMGQIMFNALNLRDISVLMAMNIFYAFIAFAVILLLDIVYVLVDPRIRFE